MKKILLTQTGGKTEMYVISVEGKDGSPSYTSKEFPVGQAKETVELMVREGHITMDEGAEIQRSDQHNSEKVYAAFQEERRPLTS